MIDTYLIRDTIDDGYWEPFNQATVLRLHAMGVLDHVGNKVEGTVTIHYYRKAA